MVGSLLSSSVYGQGMPRQKLSLAQKDKAWRERCVETITNYGYTITLNGRNTKQEKQLNYNIKNGGFDPADFEHVTDSYGLGNQFGGNPAQLVMKNLVGPKIDRLKGEEMQRPFAWMARGSGGAVLTARQEEKKRLVGEYLQAMYQNLQQGGTGSEQEMAQQGVQLPPSIEKYMRSQYLDPREVTANQILTYLIKRDALPLKFNQMFEDALISAEEIGYTGIVSGHPSLRVTNPLNFDYPHNEETKWIQHSAWGREEQWLMAGQILDLYGEHLDNDFLDKLDDGQLGNYFQGSNGSLFTDLYSPSVNALRPAGGILVQTVAWRSWKKVGFLTYPDPKTGQPQKTVVDDSFILPKELKAQGATLEWEWQTQVWMGTRIGRDHYVDIKPIRGADLPWIGLVHNNRNAKAASLIDLCKADQYTYMIVWWKLEMELAKHKGRRMLYDTSMLPTTGPNALSMDQFINYGETIGVMFYNSKAEINGRPAGANSGGNMFQEVNLSGDGSYIQALLTVLTQIEGRIDALTGVSRQREGDIRASESATGVGNAISQSSLVTEPWFYFHNEVKGHILTALLELAKEAYADGTTLPVMVDEIYSTLLKVDGDQLLDSDHGVFITNSSKDWADMTELKGYMNAAMQAKIISFTSIVGMVGAKSISEVKEVVAKGEREAQETAQASQKAQQDHEAQLAQMQSQTQQAEWNNANQQKELDRQNKIQVATISTLRGKDGPSDMDGNGIPDPIEQGKLALQASAHQASVVANQTKTAMEGQKAQMSHQTTMRKLDLETEKVNQKAAEVNLQHAQFTREQDQQDHNKALDLTTQKSDKQTKTQELALRARELATKQAEGKAKLLQDAQQKGAERKLQAQLHAATLAHQTKEGDKNRDNAVKLVKLKPKPSSGK